MEHSIWAQTVDPEEVIRLAEANVWPIGQLAPAALLPGVEDVRAGVQRIRQAVESQNVDSQAFDDATLQQVIEQSYRDLMAPPADELQER